MTGGLPMAGEKRFGTSLFGFKKKHVNSYTEKMLADFESMIRSKDEEIASLKNQMKETRAKYEEIAVTKEQISQVLIEAHDRAGQILAKAGADADEERKKLEGLLEGDRERLVDSRKHIKQFRERAAEAFDEFLKKLDDMDS